MTLSWQNEYVNKMTYKPSKLHRQAVSTFRYVVPYFVPKHFRTQASRTLGVSNTDSNREPQPLTGTLIRGT